MMVVMQKNTQKQTSLLSAEMTNVRDIDLLPTEKGNGWPEMESSDLTTVAAESAMTPATSKCGKQNVRVFFLSFFRFVR